MSATRAIPIYLCALVIMLVAIPAYAGGGTVLVRRETADIGFAFAPSEMGQDVLVIASPTSPRPWWCDAPPDEILYTRWMNLFTPTGSIHANAHGNYFTWVYYGVRDKDLSGKPGSDKWWAGLCPFMDTHTPGADGISTYYYTDNSVSGVGPGAFSWGSGLSGTLTDRVGTCSSRMVDFLRHYRLGILPGSDYPACWPDCMVVRSEVGPLLTCSE